MCLSCYNQQSRYDPTRTLTLRNAFARKMSAKFRDLRGVIRRTIVDKDCFGLVGPTTFERLPAPASRAFDFPRSQDKVTAFLDWLDTMEEQGILETTRIRQVGEVAEEAWTDIYIRDSYKRGVMRARYELDKAGFDVPTIAESGGVDAVLSTGPFHAERLGLLYSRTFNGLKGITDAMDLQISQVLAQGLGDGDNPRLLAKKLLATIDGKGRGTLKIRDVLGRAIPAERRAKMLARTEIIRAHHHGNINEMRSWAVEGVRVRAEWVTAGFNVCPDCRDLEGQIFTLDEIQNKIPLHPNCRCVAIPASLDEMRNAA